MKHSVSTIFIVLLLLSCCRNKQLESSKIDSTCPTTFVNKEWNGVNLVATSSQIDSSAISPIVNLNANSVAIIPFGFIRSGKSNVEYNLEWQWFGEKKIGTIEQIQLAKNAGLKVLLKPHLWLHDGWVGDLEFTTEEDWANFEKTYTTYILDFAQIADSMKVEFYCIGVELRKVSTQRPDFWIQLIEKVRAIYSGKLTYAANWDNYEKIAFWDKLNYIGIDAYFPISEEKTPTVEDLIKGWETDFNQLKARSKQENKPVIFTEFGYRNIDFVGKEPWTTSGNASNNTEAQNNAYKAIFCKFWNESWFTGGFLWKWYPAHSKAGGKENNRFTPQNKPIEKVIRTQYLKSK